MEVIINPKIIDTDSETEVDEEGCLSINKFICYVKRPKKIVF